MIPDFESMADVEFVKWLMVYLVDKHDFAPDGYVMGRMQGVIAHMEAEHLEPEEAPSAEHPNLLRDRLVDIVFKGYIGVSVSKVKASKVVDKILFTLTAFYEKQERDELARQADRIGEKA
jgi:hypothetical protein